MSGARQLDKLAADLSKIQNNCPRFLRKNDTSEILAIVLRRYDWFVMKNGFVCLKEDEDDLVEEIMEEMDDYNDRIPFDAMTQIIPPDHDDRRYLHSAEQWNVGVKDFVSRNSHVFVYWDEHIWSKKYLFSNGQEMKRFQRDLLAVLYYSQFVNGPVHVKSLRGHFNQASNEVKAACAPRESDFKEFLERNAFFFVMRGNNVQECPPHRLACIDNSWHTRKTKNQSLSLSTAKPTAKPRKSSEPKSPTADPIYPLLQPIVSPRKPENPVSKAFSDMQAEFLSPKFNLGWCGQQASSCRQTTETISPLLFGTWQVQSPTTQVERLYSSPEAAVFKKLIGNRMSTAIQDEILANDNLNSLILLRLNVGKQPMALFRIPGEKNGLKHDLNLEPCKVEDIQRILRQPEVVKSNDCTNRYGITGTLHSILTRESGNKVSSLTLRCQIHEPSDGLGLEVRKWKNFTAVFTGNYPDKHMYNFLRSSCTSLSKTEDVLVIDVDGQLSGSEIHPHPSLGSVTRISCVSPSELCPLILESIQHMHGHMITISVDSTEHLNAIRKMCSQGTKVLAAVSCELKAEAEALFL